MKPLVNGSTSANKEGLNGREPVTAYTLKNYHYHSEIIKMYEWHKPIQELLPPDIINFCSWLLRSGRSRSLAGKVLTTLQSIFKEMTLRGYLSTNVAAGINIQQSSRYDTPVEIPTKGEVLSLLVAADRMANSKNLQTAQTWERYRPMLYLAVDSGMRPQEYLAISRSDLKSNGVNIEKAIEGDSSNISVTKTPAGRRFVELSSDEFGCAYHIITRDDRLETIAADVVGHYMGREAFFTGVRGKAMVV